MINDEKPMKAVLSVTFDGQFVIHDIKVISTNDKHFIVMPSKKNPDGTFRDIAHPITREFREKIQEAVLKEYQKALKEEEAGIAAEIEGIEEENDYGCSEAPAEKDTLPDEHLSVPEASEPRLDASVVLSDNT